MIGGIANQTNVNQQTLIKQGTIQTWFRLTQYDINIQFIAATIRYRDLNQQAFVVGHPTLSEVGSTSDARVGSGSGVSWTNHQSTLDPNNNQLTDVARTQFAKWLDGDAPDPPDYFAFGSGSTAFAVTDTTLGTEERRTSDTATSSNVGGYHGRLEKFHTLTPDGSTYTLREVGCFDATASGNMWDRFVCTSNLSVTATMELGYSIQYEVDWYNNTSGSSIMTTHGVQHFRDYWKDGDAVFDYTEMSDGTGTPSAADTSLDGSNKDRNQITVRTRNNYSVEIITVWTTSEFNGNDMNKIGNFIDSGGNTLITETLIQGKEKLSTFKVRNIDIFNVTTGA